MSAKHSATANVKDTRRQPKKKHKGWKIFGIILLILVMIALGVVAGGYVYLNDKLGKMQQVEIKEEDLNINEKVEEKLSGYRNIAIFGVDSRSSDLGKGNRSDCIIIASINQETKEVRLASVYRDTYVQIEDYGLDKINHAYSYGEAPLALNTLNTNLDLNVKEFVTVNFDAVAEAVDALGGITMEITSAETEYINEYIRETSRVTGKSADYITSAGTYRLNGVQAVAYGRIRYTAGGDYKRTERMRDVIEAMLKELKNKSIGEINSFLDDILPMIYTNVSSGSIISEIPNIANYRITESVGWPYEVRGITLERWFGVPVTLESNVQRLHQELFGEADYVVSDTVQEISQKIINRTGYSD